MKMDLLKMCDSWVLFDELLIILHRLTQFSRKMDITYFMTEFRFRFTVHYRESQSV